MADQKDFFPPDESNQSKIEQWFESLSPKDKSYFARNVPMNFNDCCQYVSENLAPNLKRLNDHHVRQYGRMLEVLFDGTETEEVRNKVAEEIRSIHVKYYTSQRTMDFNVRASEVYKRLTSIQRPLSRALSEIADDDRDHHLREVGIIDENGEIPNTLEDFKNASSIAERATIGVPPLGGPV